MKSNTSQDQFDQRKLNALIKRRHPLYERMKDHWNFLAATFEGGRDWFEDNVHRYHKEGNKEYADRVHRAYRFNHTREVVELTGKYLFKVQAARSADAPKELTDFWNNASLDGLPIRDFMKEVSTKTSVYGRMWVVVDTTASGDTRSLKEQNNRGDRAYAYLVTPQNLLDASFDDKGVMRWCLIHELVRDDADPMTSSGALESQFRLWERDKSTLFKVKGKGETRRVLPQPPIHHGLGEVPVFGGDNVISAEKWASPSMVADVAYLDRAVANYLSNLDAIIQDQTFSQLAMPTQAISSGDEDDVNAKLLEMGTKRVFTYDGGHAGSAPFFLSPDVKQAQLLLQVINKIINEIYHSVGLAGERTKEDNAVGIDNSSGVAKAYDFERVNGLLASKADSLEAIENRMAALVMKYHGKSLGDPRPVSYPDDFDVRSLYDEFEIAARLQLIEAPDGIRQEQMKSVIDKLFPKLKEELKQKLLEELKSWPPEPPIELPAQGGDGSIKKAGKQSVSASLMRTGAAA